jgi:prepilin-type N-terminal cleavage/methylation domain-containing protein
MSCKRTGMTLIELMVVLAIITLLVGIFLPATAMVKKTAKEAKQKAQFSAIELALEAFRNDYSDYPPSYGGAPPAAYTNYCGAQKLAEALLGWDLLGFHPSSDFRADGRTNKGVYIYDVNNPMFFDQRKGTYLDMATANVFRLGNISFNKPGLYSNTAPLAPDTYVLCDIYGRKKIKLIDGSTVTAGSPILYFRADTTKKTIGEIYNVHDNESVVVAKELDENRQIGSDPLYAFTSTNQYQNFYNYIRDPKRETIPWPYRSDSYILISAGADGLYGTSDDIRNFGN